MTAFDLVPHPDYPGHSATGIRVYVVRPMPRSLRLTFLVSVSMRDLRLSDAKPPQRRDDLWRTTCFELFVQQPEAYWEFNFSPSTEWAAYGFSGYRAGMRSLSDMTGVVVDQSGGSEWYELQATLDLPPMAEDRPAIGLSAIVEANDGTKSYWALAHACGAPDFHHTDCFAARLPAVDA